MNGDWCGSGVGESQRVSQLDPKHPLDPKQSRASFGAGRLLASSFLFFSGLLVSEGLNIPEYPTLQTPWLQTLTTLNDLSIFRLKVRGNDTHKYCLYRTLPPRCQPLRVDSSSRCKSQKAFPIPLNPFPILLYYHTWSIQNLGYSTLTNKVIINKVVLPKLKCGVDTIAGKAQIIKEPRLIF